MLVIDASLTFRQVYLRDPMWLRRMAAERHGRAEATKAAVYSVSRRHNPQAPRFVSRAEVLELLAKERPGAVERFLDIAEP